jgi:hypothetical protein
MRELILSHTAQLLQSGVLDHLQDEMISRLHHMLLQGSGAMIHEHEFFSVWRKGDYTGSFKTLQLLQHSNCILQHCGQSKIEMDFLETVTDVL